MKMNFKEDFENLKCFILMYLNRVVGYVVAWKAPNQPPLRSQLSFFFEFFPFHHKTKKVLFSLTTQKLCALRTPTIKVYQMPFTTLKSSK
jgi:hypothetical protein